MEAVQRGHRAGYAWSDRRCRCSGSSRRRTRSRCARRRDPHESSPRGMRPRRIPNGCGTRALPARSRACHRAARCGPRLDRGAAFLRSRAQGTPPPRVGRQPGRHVVVKAVAQHADELGGEGFVQDLPDGLEVGAVTLGHRSPLDVLARALAQGAGYPKETVDHSSGRVGNGGMGSSSCGWRSRSGATLHNPAREDESPLRSTLGPCRAPTRTPPGEGRERMCAPLRASTPGTTIERKHFPRSLDSGFNS